MSDFAARLRRFMQASAGAVVCPPTATSARGPSDLEEAFNALALDLFALQFTHNLPYRRWCESRGVSPGRVDRWQDLPAVPTSTFKEIDWTSLRPDERSAVFYSSGTTSQRRSRHFHHAESLALYEASVQHGFEAGLRRAPACTARRFFCLTPPREQAPHSSLAHMFEGLIRAQGEPGSAFFGCAQEDGAWAVELSALIDALQKIAADAQPVALLGTAFQFVHLLDALTEREQRLRLPPGSWLLETGGYKGRTRELPRATLHQRLRERLGLSRAQIICEYGMAELSSQAYAVADPYEEQAPPDASSQARDIRVFHFPPWARVRVLDPETGREAGEGEEGLICVLDLANVWSVSAVQTEDLAVKRDTGFTLLGRVPQAEARGCSLLSSEEVGA